MAIIFEPKYAPASIVLAVDRLIAMKKNKDKWTVITEILKIWDKLNLHAYKSHIINIKDVKSSRKVTRVGSKEFSGVTYDKKTGGYLNYTLDIPEKVINIIRKLYTTEELPMNKKFFREFAKRYPIFTVSQRR